MTERSRATNEIGVPPGSMVDQFDVLGNELIIGGVSASELLRRSGGRAAYAYDKAVVTRNIERVKSALPLQVKLHYAVKANPMPDVVHHVAGMGIGLDVASAKELSVAITCGVPVEDISFAGPGKSADDLTAGVEAGVVMVIESEHEAHRVASLAAEMGSKIPCAIRVNPNFALVSSGMKMGGGAQQFGIDSECVPALIGKLRDLSLDVVGFHVFTGSQNLNGPAIIEGQRKVLELAEGLASHLSSDLQWLNIGGGLGVPYFSGDRPLELSPIMSSLNEELNNRSGVLGNAEVVMELGRFLVASAGVYLCTIVDKKVSRGTTFLITNGGLHHHLAATGNFGQIIRRNYPIALANRLESSDRETVTVVGPLCTPLDLLGKDLDLPRAEIGDIICVFMSGAYGYTASPLGFLSHPPPLEFFL